MSNYIGIRNRLEAILSNKCYLPLLQRLNDYRTPSYDRSMRQAADKAYTAASVARSAERKINRDNSLLDPVEVGELTGPLELFRFHDGSSSSLHSAGTLGSYWMNRELMENVWLSTKGLAEGRSRCSAFLHIMRSCNLVLFQWSHMTQLACLTIPEGGRLPVVTGQGSWQAFGLPPAPDALKNKTHIRRQLGNMSTEPTTQYFLPLLNPLWIQPIVEGSASWPFPAKHPFNG